MAELYPSDTDLNALSGTSDAGQEVLFVSTGESPYYTSFYKMLQRLLNVARRAGDLRVYQDDDLTYGVRAGKFYNGDSLVSYAGATAQALTNNATNYIYLTAAGVLTKNTTGFPTPSTTPFIPLATILTASGTYDGRDSSEGGDITDYRGCGLMGVVNAATAAVLNEAQAFFAATDISGAEAETLTDGSNADAKHVHAVAGLQSAVQNLMPTIAFSGTDGEDGTGTMDVQIQNAAGTNIAANYLARVWIADADMSEPDAQTGFSVATGETMRTIEANADIEVITDATGLAVMSIDAGGAKTVYVMAEIDGKIYSESLAITVP